MARTALPLSLTQAVAAEHLAELRADAERHRLVRVARGGRRRHTWPTNVAVALRDSLAGVLPTRTGRGGTAPCPTC